MIFFLSTFCSRIDTEYRPISNAEHLQLELIITTSKQCNTKMDFGGAEKMDLGTLDVRSRNFGYGQNGFGNLDLWDMNKNRLWNLRVRTKRILMKKLSWNFGGMDEMDEMDFVRKNWISEDWGMDKMDPELWGYGQNGSWNGRI